VAISSAPWGNVSASSYSDTSAYCSACLIDLNPSGQAKTQSNCKLPVKMPNGDVNRNAVHAASAALAGARGGVQAPASAKRTAARALVRLYGQMNETPPDSLKRLAGGG